MKNTFYKLIMIAISVSLNLKIHAQSCPSMTITASPPAICAGQSSTLSVTWVSGGQYTWTPGGSNASQITVSPSVTSTYTLTGKRGTCTKTQTIALTVNQLPVISVNSGAICMGQSFTMVPSGASTYTFSSGSSVVSPTITTSYSVTGTNAAGCVSAFPAISNITVQASPTITVNSGAICSGESFTMVPSGASTYTFSGGSAVVSPTVTTSYSVTGTNAEGCVSGSPAISNVTVNPLPVVNAGPDQTVYYGYAPLQCAILSGSVSGATAPYQYSWSNGALTQSTTVCPTVTTVYALTVTANGCSGSDQLTIEVINVSCQKNKVVVCHNGHTICISSSAVAMHLAHGDILGPCNNPGSLKLDEHSNEITNEHEKVYSLYPNPNTGSFIVEVSKIETNTPGKIEIRNSIGHVVYSKYSSINSSRKEYIELDKTLPAGIYFLNIVEGKNVYVTKLILLR